MEVAMSLRFLILMAVILCVAMAQVATTEKPKGSTTTGKPMKATDRRDKRQLGNTAASSGSNFPIFYDGVGVNPPLQQLPPLQPLPLPLPLPPLQQLQPGQGQGQGQGQTQSSWLPNFGQNFGQNLPIIGTLVGGLPNLISSLGLGNLNGGFGNLGGLNLGQLGLGGLTPVVAAPVPVPVPITPNQQCPLTQKLSCRCEPLLQLPGQKLSSQLRGPQAQSQSQSQSQLVQILRQNVRRNEDGSQELRVVLSSGHVLYQRTAKDLGQSGHFAMRLPSGRFFNIFYSVNEKEYTVRADVKDAPPSSDLDEELTGQI
ncbi:uncharacterized protein LOC117588693 [Drosophila guanche]|uniref:DUF4794 domain-containing protein n=1 Tax=Drosophila guanche TaxID=7266 RepID=A0A3B0KL44_DROGU|nr:uncharacterized protein LOC117588693 [Drosophila guanche]SPP86536.1 Hypothetical predicted protein [Drosophila guanche]